MSNAETLLMETRQTYERLVGAWTGKTVSLKKLLQEITLKADRIPRRLIEHPETPDMGLVGVQAAPKKKAVASLSRGWSALETQKSTLEDDGRRSIIEIDWLCKDIPKMQPARVVRAATTCSPRRLVQV